MTTTDNSRVSQSGRKRKKKAFFGDDDDSSFRDSDEQSSKKEKKVAPKKPVVDTGPQHTFLALIDDGQGADGDNDNAPVENILVSQAELEGQLRSGWGEWIGDNILDAYVRMLKGPVGELRDVFIEQAVHVSVITQLTPAELKLRGERFSRNERYADSAVILMPTFVNGNHWVLIEVLINECVINVYDSVSDSWKSDKRALARIKVR